MLEGIGNLWEFLSERYGFPVNNLPELQILEAGKHGSAAGKAQM